MVWRRHLKKGVLIQMHTYLHLHFRPWHWRCRVLFYPIMESQLFPSLVGGLLTFEKHLKDSDFSPITDYLILQSQTFTHLVHIICILAMKDLTGWKQKGTRRQKRGNLWAGNCLQQSTFLDRSFSSWFGKVFWIRTLSYLNVCVILPKLSWTSDTIVHRSCGAVVVLDSSEWLPNNLWYLYIFMGVTEWVCNLPATQ